MLQNRILPEVGASSSDRFADSWRMETSLPLQQTRRLGFCKQTSPWPQADLGPGDPAQIYSSRRRAGWNSQTIRMAHVPPHLLDPTAERWDRIQSDARTAASFFVAFNLGRVHAGNLTSEARCTGSRTRSRIFIRRGCTSVSPAMS